MGDYSAPCLKEEVIALFFAQSSNRHNLFRTLMAIVRIERIDSIEIWNYRNLLCQSIFFCVTLCKSNDTVHILLQTLHEKLKWHGASVLVRLKDCSARVFLQREDNNPYERSRNHYIWAKAVYFICHHLCHF